NPPLVSVIVCAYNAEQYIDESISSIINQSYENLEIIVINDGSTDLTLSHLEKISKLDERIKIISNKYNLGFINSLNIGLGCFSGKYIARMDADDIAKPSWIEKIVTYLEKNDHITAMGSYLEIIVEKECGIIGSQYKTGDIWKNSLIHNEICEAMLFYNPIHNNTMIMRANVYREHKLIFNKDYPYAEDYKFWSEVSRLGCLANYPEALVKYRLHGNQASSVHNHKQNEVAKKIKRENITYYLNKIGIDINVINSVSLLEIYHVDKSNKVLKSILYDMYMSLDKYTITSLLHFIKYHLKLFDLKQNFMIIKKFIRKINVMF
ncbi:TPA: glycosyltransferase family 2 protein, partial [Haemophilus influenzae]